MVAIKQRDDESVSSGCGVVSQIGTLWSRPLHRGMDGEVLRKRSLTDSETKNQREQNELAAPPKRIHATMHHVLNYLLRGTYFLFFVVLNHLSTRRSSLLPFEDTGIVLLILEDTSAIIKLGAYLSVSFFR